MEPKYKVGDFLICYYYDGSDVICVEPRDEEEYQLYLKLKEKYG